MIRTLLILLILSAFFIGSAFGQKSVEFVRPLTPVAPLITIHQQKILEKSLGKFFPVRSLRRTSRSEGKISDERITYDILKQHGVKYAVVIYSGSWKQEASQLAIFRIEAGGYPSPVFRSHNWRSNYTDSYHEIQSIALGKENIILIKEGEMGESRFVVASIFTFREKRGDEDHEGYFIINDLTPQMPRLKAVVGFPLKALYAQAVLLQKHSAMMTSLDYLTLQAGDVEFLWDINPDSRGLSYWKYDRSLRKFMESRISIVDGR